MKVTSASVTVSDGQHCSMVRWTDREDEATILTVDGQTVACDPHAAELLYDALHELFGKETK